jgi:rRNA small subunit pseudouridine methyltransferase Nep1
MLTMMLAEAEVELMPTELTHHPAVIAYARQRRKQPTQVLLDSNYHHSAMTNLSEGRRRGRPDITHLFLLTVLESIINKKGQINIIVHTRNDMVITVNPETRIMRNYERFLGLMETLLEKHVVPDEKQPLLSLRQNIPLKQAIEQVQADTVITFSKDGSSVILPDYFKELKKQKKNHLLCIIGGFPSGTFHTDLKTIASNNFSLYPEMLPAWTVASEILVNYGNMSR